jgi:hypothetical protein
VNHALESLFPGLRGKPYGVTSPAQVDYNCVAWAAGDNSRWWWPDEFGQYYWPEGATRRATLDAFVEAFHILGFEVCENPSLEAGWEKVAVYAKHDGSPTHVARQLPDGAWTSKLGSLYDIKHPGLEEVSGDDYGNPVVILRRRRPASTPLEANP